MTIDLKAELEKMAALIVKEADMSGDSAPSFTEKVEALSELTKLYIAFQKHPAEDDADTAEFNFAQGVQPASQGGTNGSPTARLLGRRRPAANS